MAGATQSDVSHRAHGGAALANLHARAKGAGGRPQRTVRGTLKPPQKRRLSQNRTVSAGAR